jgi:hypothetical protein
MYKAKQIEKLIFEIDDLLRMTEDEYHEEFVADYLRPQFPEKHWMQVCNKLLTIITYQQTQIENLEEGLTEKQNKATANLLKLINGLKKELKELKQNV